MGQLVRFLGHIISFVLIVLDHRKAADHIPAASEEPKASGLFGFSGHCIHRIIGFQPLMHILPAIDSVVVHLGQWDILFYKDIRNAAAGVVATVPQVRRCQPLVYVLSAG